MPTYDIVNGLEAKPRLQIDHQKVCVFWDTNLGASEEALVDAYIAAHGLNTAFKYGVDLSLTGYTDRLTLWDLWLSDVADFIETNQIQAICCSPNCPLTQFFIEHQQLSYTSFSTLLASSVSIKNILLSEVIGIETLLSGRFDDHAVKFTAIKTMDNLEDVYYLQNGGLLRDDLPVKDSGFNIGGIESDDFKYSNYRVPQLWSTDFDSVQGRTGIEPRNPHYGAAILKIPSWRIGWKASGNMPSPTAQEITNMVNRGKAAGAISFNDHKTQSRIAMTLRDRTNDGHCGKGVAIGKLLEEIGYTNYNYGFRTTHSNTLANIPAVDDSSLAHFKKLDPISDQTDSRFVSTNAPVLDSDPDPVNSSTIRYYDDASVSAGQKGMRLDAYNGATFPIECFIHFSLFGNFDTDNNLEFYNTASPSSQTIKVKDGGCVIELTSHGHKISPMALRHGASAAFCSYSEPSALSPIMRAERFLFSLLRGNSYAIAANRTQYDWTDEHELWGDGLATPYSEQSNEITPETKKMKKTHRAIIGGPTLQSSAYFFQGGTVGSITGSPSMFPAYLGQPNDNKGVTDFFIDHAYELTNGGTGYQINDELTITGGSGSNARFKAIAPPSPAGVITGLLLSPNNNSTLSLQRGTGYQHGDVLTATGSITGSNNARITVRNDFLYQIKFATDDFSFVTPLGEVTIGYQGLSTDSLEDITDGLIAACKANAGINALYEFEKIQGSNADKNGRFGIRAIYGASLLTNETQVVTPIGTPFQGLISQQFLIAGAQYHSQPYSSSGDYKNSPLSQTKPLANEIRNDNDDIIFQASIANVTSADAAGAGISFPEATRTLLFLTPTNDDAKDIARMVALNGVQPAITKITFKNTQRDELADIVILGTDLNPWVNVSSTYNYATLNANSGAANRTIDFEVGNVYEVTLEFSAKDLGLSGTKRLVRRAYC